MIKFICLTCSYAVSACSATAAQAAMQDHKAFAHAGKRVLHPEHYDGSFRVRYAAIVQARRRALPAGQGLTLAWAGTLFLASPSPFFGLPRGGR